MSEKVIFTVLGVGNHPAPFYIVDSDVNARDGVGSVVFTDDIRKAKRFENAEAAKRYWTRQSIVRPTINGQPNRPLTAFTCDIVDAAKAEMLQ